MSCSVTYSLLDFSCSNATHVSTDIFILSLLYIRKTSCISKLVFLLIYLQTYLGSLPKSRLSTLLSPIFSQLRIFLKMATCFPIYFIYHSTVIRSSTWSFTA